MSKQINQQVLYFPKEAIKRAVFGRGNGSGSKMGKGSKMDESGQGGKKVKSGSSIDEVGQILETPFFLYSEARLRENCQNFKKAFIKYFPDFHVLYAVKANNNPEILKIIKEEGFGFDCSSESEAWITKKIGGWGMYTGNYTPASTLKFAKECNMMLNLDDASMVSFLKEIGVPEHLSFRINPGIGGGEGISVVTAGPDAKFGVPYEKAAEAYEAARKIGVKKFGIHMMTGSNVRDENYFVKTVARLLEVVADVKKKTGIEIEIMNIGGGFGVPYKPEDKSLDIELTAKLIREVFDSQCKKFGIKEPVLMAEPGRYVVADMGWLIGRVQVIKNGYKKFIGIDAASNDMPRPSIYEAYHHVSVIKNGAKNETETVSVVGSICENNDQFARDRELTVCEIGDVVVIHNCGGHAFAMGHNYNGRVRHAEYLLQENGELRMIRRAETFEDLYRTTENL